MAAGGGRSGKSRAKVGVQCVGDVNNLALSVGVCGDFELWSRAKP
jgi:hypothetical protein